jgi:hypothetical protein
MVYEYDLTCIQQSDQLPLFEELFEASMIEARSISISAVLCLDDFDMLTDSLESRSPLFRPEDGNAFSKITDDFMDQISLIGSSCRGFEFAYNVSVEPSRRHPNFIKSLGIQVGMPLIAFTINPRARMARFATV